MADKPRKADVFAAPGSIAGGLRARRKAIESGQPELAAKAFRDGLKRPDFPAENVKLKKTR